MPKYMKIVKTGHLIFFLLIGGLFAAEISLEAAVDRILGSPGRGHLSADLHTVAKYGHSLSQDKKDALIAAGFDFSRELVTTSRPQNLDESTESGFFKFHYTQSGDDGVSPVDTDGNGIPDYVDLIVSTFDSISRVDFTDMEYIRPPSDGWYWQYDNGGSDLYDVYIFELETGYYGYVQAEDYAQNTGFATRGDNEYSESVDEDRAMTTFMALRNNYDGFTGVESEIIQVTSAHEFFHAVQYGYDGWEAGWLLEATAVWMEEVHYDEINDCYQYLEEFFEYPEWSINRDVNRGYGAYIYFSYLTDNRVSTDFIRTIFERSVEYDSFNQDHSISTLTAALSDYGLGFESVTHDFFIANAVLSSDTSAGVYQYTEADSFPMSTPLFTSSVTSMTDSVKLYTGQQLETFSALYYLINTSDSTWTNVVIDLLSSDSDDMNYYVTSVVQDTNNSYSILTSDTQTLDVTSIDTVVFLVSAFGYDTTDTEFSLRIIKNSSVILHTDQNNVIPSKFSLGYPYPNPFNNQIQIRYTIPQDHAGTITITDILGREVSVIDVHVESATLIWRGTNFAGAPVASGVYLISLESGGRIINRKISLLK